MPSEDTCTELTCDSSAATEPEGTIEVKQHLRGAAQKMTAVTAWMVITLAKIPLMSDDIIIESVSILIEISLALVQIMITINHADTQTALLLLMQECAAIW